MPDNYDYVVIGSGPAGHVSALTAAGLGLRTLLVEKDTGMLGGVCLNEGCIPAKALFSGLYSFKKKFKSHIGPGTGVHEDPEGIMKELLTGSSSAVENLKKGLNYQFKKAGVDLVEARAEFSGKTDMILTDRNGERSHVFFKKALIASGSEPAALKGFPFDGETVISSSDAIHIRNIPRKMLIIGAGAIGVEFSFFFSALGVEVTLAEKLPFVLAHEDRDVSSSIRIELKKAGVEVMTGVSVSGLKRSKGMVDVEIVDISANRAERNFEVVMPAIGRIPVTSDLSLEKAGIEVNEVGFIPVDGKMRTSQPHIFAAGDVVPGRMLAHTAQAEGEAAAFSAAGIERDPLDMSSIPNAVYSEIQAASVGITHQHAEENNIDVIIGKSFFKANGKAVASGETEGFVKIIANRDDLVVLGAHITGRAATELISELVLAVRKELTLNDIACTVHPHPTLSEAIAEAAKDALNNF